MGECRHSCCKGWEIDIDPTTYARYKALPGELGRKMRSCTMETAEGGSFILTKDEHCPFLNSDGLCELILNLGKESLCDICRDHPLYRNFISNRLELGLGLCCESACRLILERRSPIRLMLQAEEGADEPFAEDEVLLLERDRLVEAAQNRQRSILCRVEAIESSLAVPAPELSELSSLMASLEVLDVAWPELLRTVSVNAADFEPDGEEEVFLENLLVYLLLRHIPEAVDEQELRTKAFFCTAMWRLLYCIYCASGRGGINSLEEICRMWSAEIEYSDENPNRIAAWLENRCLRPLPAAK